MDLLNRAYGQLYDRYRSMTPGSRLTAGLLLLVVGLSLGYLLVHQTAQPQVDLMHGAGIGPSQLPAIESALIKANLTYEIIGTSIFVPRNEEPACMAALTDAKVLPRDLGAAQREALKDGSLFDIGSERDRNRQKIAVQDTVAAAIRRKPGIEDASVLYNEETKPGFAHEKQMTALVNVEPSGNLPLDQIQVADIRALVAGGMAGFKERNVTVADLNGRTWRGDEEGAMTADKLISLKRAYEQDLKAKILNALYFISGATVEVNMQLGGDRSTPRLAKVSIGIPDSYFRRLGQERSGSSVGDTPRTPEARTLDQIRAEEEAKIQKQVAQLLPPAEGAHNLPDLVAVTSFDDLPAKALPPPAWEQTAKAWLRAYGGLLALAGLTLASLWLLRSTARAGAAERRRVALATNPAPPADIPAADRQPAEPVPLHHGLRPNPSSVTSRNDLSELVRQNPHAAAGILRTWVGSSG